MSKKSLFASLFCLFLVVMLVISNFAGVSHANAEGYTTAKGMCVMEAGSGRVLYSKNQNSPLAMASTTKIMTAITAIESGVNLDTPFEISPKAVGISGTSLYLREGEVFTLKDLLYGLMLISGNDASVAIAERVGGKEKDFIELMNKKARDIGATNTHFDNPHGLDSKTHFTSAKDLALITSYALKNPIFKEIVSTTTKKITNSEGKTRYLRNKNKLLTSLEGCCGVKTGFTDDAGRCLVSACERDGMMVVCVVLGCGPMFEESKSLLENSFKDFKLYDLTKGYSLPDAIKVSQGRVGRVKIETFGIYLYPLRESEKNKVKYQIDLLEEVEAPLDKHSEVGEVKIFVENDLHFSEKIYTMENVRRVSIWQKVKEFADRW